MIVRNLYLFIFAFATCLSFSHTHRGFIRGPPDYRERNYCQTPLGDPGTCASLKYCPEVLRLFTSLERNAAKQYSMILQGLCGNRITPDQYPILCCTRVVMTPTTDLHTPWPSITESPTPTATTTEIGDRIVSTPTTSNLCLTSDSAAGLCKLLIQCPLLLDQLRFDRNNETVKNNLHAAHTACGNKDTIVCCPTTQSRMPSTPVDNDNSPIHKLPSEDEGCGMINRTTPKIVGGGESELGAWPWMALIGYDPYSVRPFRCGGTLISGRHVITAAHCIRRDLSFVRLGEHDLSIESETRHVDINVVKHSRHPQFGKNRRSDLAILLLETTAQFTDLIAPICMPSSVRLRSKSYVDTMPYVAGWGYTQEGSNPSHVLKQVQLPVLDNDVCRRIYTQLVPSIPSDDYDDSIICAGYTIGGSDACEGDSGGPLMIPELYKGITRYYLIGVVSYGRGCGKIPGIYMSTQHKMDWILEQIETM